MATKWHDFVFVDGLYVRIFVVYERVVEEAYADSSIHAPGWSRFC